jgi:hypothetical protein
MSIDAAKWIMEWNEGVIRDAREKQQAEFEARLRREMPKPKPVEHPRLEI